MMRRVARRANVKPGVHILRHTFCSHLAMRGAPGERSRNSPDIRTSRRRSGTCTSVPQRWMRRFGCWTVRLKPDSQSIESWRNIGGGGKSDLNVVSRSLACQPKLLVSAFALRATADNLRMAPERRLVEALGGHQCHWLYIDT